MPAPIPSCETERLAAIEHYRLGGIGRETAFDHLTELATTTFDVPFAFASIVGADTQCFRGACGLDATGTSRDIAFCAFAILEEQVMVVPDARLDPRFSDNPMVIGDPQIRFYAGAPLRVAGGLAVGTLCIADIRPRAFAAADARHLAGLARLAVDMIELRVERFIAEEQRRILNDERALLKVTVENATDGMALYDGGLRLLFWNEVYADLLGLPPSLARIGTPVGDIIRYLADRGELGDAHPEAMVREFERSMRADEDQAMELRRADGRMLDTRRRAIGGGRFLVTLRDVSQERQIARLKDEFVSTVSHELRTPLTAIGGAIGLLRGGAAGELPEKAAQLANVAYKNVYRLTELVNDLLDIDRLRSGRMVFHMARAGLGPMLAEAVEQNTPYAERFGVTLALDVPDAPVVGTFDANRILQVVTNLLSNAAKFSPAGSIVTLRLTVEGDAARISVIDQGAGISPEFQARLFRRFSQEEGAHQNKRSGSGLGLAISKAIVDRHGGTITVESTPGEGATFHVVLPLDGVGED